MNTRRRPLAERLWERVDKTEGCWIWTGTTTNGYGLISLGGTKGRLVRTHRAAYELLVGPIPDGLHIDHLCRNRRCCNPKHLEPVTQAENNRRAYANHHHCPRGHLLPERREGEARRRQCVVCRSAYDDRDYEAKKAS